MQSNFPDTDIMRREARRDARPLVLAVAAAALNTIPFALATPAAAQGVIATGGGRAGATVAGLIALVGVATGGLAVRCANRAGSATARDRAIIALVTSVIGIFLGVLHFVTSSGGFGTGNGRAGAIVAAVLGLIGAALGARALSRAPRTT